MLSGERMGVGAIGHATGLTGHMRMRDGGALSSFPTKPMRPARRSFSGSGFGPGSVRSPIASGSSRRRELPGPYSHE